MKYKANATDTAQPAPKARELILQRSDGDDLDHAIANVNAGASLSAAQVITAYDNTGQQVNFTCTIKALAEHHKKIKAGDLSQAENMLMSQAVALQSMFSDLALRAKSQTNLPQFQVITGLALKAQCACRATLQALGDLKYPRQATFVKQANISQGPQQVNNGNTRTGETEIQQNKLIEGHDHGRTSLDSGTTPDATRGNPTMAALEPVHGPEKPRR